MPGIGAKRKATGLGQKTGKNVSNQVPAGRPPGGLRLESRPTPPRQPATDRIDGQRAVLDVRLRDGLARLHLVLDDATVGRLLDYLALLGKWNAVYNLTAIRDPHAMLVQHLLDSLAIVPTLQARLRPARADAAWLVVDVGSGGGLPGIVLAIVWPAAQLHLVEPVGKKGAFLRQCALELGLANVRVHVTHVERLTPASLEAKWVELGPEAAASTPGRPTGTAGTAETDSRDETATPDLILCRAFASLADFVSGIDALAAPTTIVAAMKGVYPDEELAGLPASWALTGSQRLEVPFLEAERHLLLLRREPVKAASVGAG